MLVFNEKFHFSSVTLKINQNDNNTLINLRKFSCLALHFIFRYFALMKTIFFQLVKINGLYSCGKFLTAKKKPNDFLFITKYISDRVFVRPSNGKDGYRNRKLTDGRMDI